MYCESCAIIKNDSVEVISQITNNLFLSGMVAAGKFDGHRLCVHEKIPTYEGQYYHIPILEKCPNNSIDRTGALVSMDGLNRATDLIEQYMNKNERLLVHCVGGVERSPLTLAWYFVQSKKFETLNEAYVFLRSKRPVVSDRQFWLP